jgi:hypothetical protein
MLDTLELPKRDREHERVIGIVFDVSPSQASVISCLSRATLVTGKELLDYGDASSHIKVVISRARTKLRSHGMDIHSKPEVGYWIDADDRRTIDKMVQLFLGGK